MRTIDLFRLSLIIAIALPAGCQSAGYQPSNVASSNRPPETSQSQAPTLSTSDVVGEKFEAWVGAINSAERGALDRVWSGAEDAAVRVPADMIVSERTGGIDLHRVEEATETEMVAIVRAKRTGRWLCLQFGVDSEPPHVIQTILLRPTTPPSDPKTGGEKPSLPFDDKARAGIVQALTRELNRAYVFPEKAVEVARELEARQRRHAYDQAASRIAFARALTDDMQRLTRDKHLHVEVTCSRGAARSARADEGLGSDADRPRVFGEVRRLEGNIAYVDIATFGVDAARARDEIRTTMSGVADAAAIVLDVRHNEGGQPETVALLSSYLFGGEPVHLNSLYWRLSDRTDDFFTDPLVQGKKFGPTKAVYVLTSSRTFSAAEEFAYNLQSRKRAVIVGETTAGGAHPGDFFPLPQGFSVFVPSGRAINPVTQTNWEGTGVKPDVVVAADAALETAHKLALTRGGS